MTTIAIDHNTISADGRTTGNEIIQCDTTVKVNKRDGIIYAFSGSVTDAEILMDIVFEDAEIPDFHLNANVVTIADGDVVVHGCSEDGYKSWSVNLPYSLGSGSAYALAAMDLGKTSKEAVKYAMTRDIYSGGKIKTMTWRK
tara:strand:- start:32451 stop:32876 length:426 start_codon:yes stop_codon:yes gene_type:complete